MTTPSHVCVFASGDPGLLALAKSLLQAERIEYLAKNEMGLAAMSTYGSAGPAQLWVRSADANASRTILNDLTGCIHE
jgi:hypothetical protein